MQQFAIRQAFLGGNVGIRSSMFAGNANDPFISLGRSWLGQTGQQWYARAKQAVAKYDQWIVEARKVANAQSRERLLDKYYGDPTDDSTALYRRNTVAGDIAQAESFTPINYIVFDEGRRQGRIEKLEDWQHDLRSDTKDESAKWGSLPDPIIIEKLVPGDVPGWFLPATIGLGAVAVAALLGAFGKL